MKKFNKFTLLITIILIAILSFTTVACSNNDGDNNTGDNGANNGSTDTGDNGGNEDVLPELDAYVNNSWNNPCNTYNGITVDGKIDDGAWANQNVLEKTFTVEGVTTYTVKISIND